MSFQMLSISYILTLVFSVHGLQSMGTIKSKLYFLSPHSFSVSLGG